jgi:integrase
MTFGDALALHLSRLQADVEARRVKASTLHYWRQVFAAVAKSWPELEGRDVRRVTPADREQWARKFARKCSSTRFNNAIAGLRHVFDVAVDDAIIYSNPAAPLKRARVVVKPLELQFDELLQTIRTAGAWCSKDCADFVEGLAVTGARKGEANEIVWRDIEFDREEIVLRGNSESATKNWRVHRVPMIPAARALFERMRAVRWAEPLDAKVFRVREAQRALDAACRKLALPRITHHTLRHFFATMCAQSGVDMPTIAKFLNHKDSGRLADRIYVNPHGEHMRLQALRVRFGGPVESDKIIQLSTPQRAG